MNLNPREGVIINRFGAYAAYHYDCLFLLRWSDTDYILAEYDQAMEDENDPDGGIDDPEFEEFWSFLFRVKEVHGHPPVEPYNGFILVNYHNFPEEILHDGVKVN